MRWFDQLDKIFDGVRRLVQRPMMVQCADHSQARAAFVCNHLVQSLKDGVARGFAGEVQVHNWNAYCADCSELIESNQGDWNAKLMKLTGIETVCEGCLAGVASINGVEIDR